MVRSDLDEVSLRDLLRDVFLGGKRDGPGSDHDCLLEEACDEVTVPRARLGLSMSVSDEKP